MRQRARPGRLRRGGRHEGCGLHLLPLQVSQPTYTDPAGKVLVAQTRMTGGIYASVHVNGEMVAYVTQSSNSNQPSFGPRCPNAGDVISCAITVSASTTSSTTPDRERDH